MLRKAFCTAALLSLAGGTAMAADNGVYLGVALAQSDSAVDSGTLNLSDTHSGFKAFGGLRPIDHLAVEVDYADYGRAGTAGASLDSKTTSAYVLAIAPIALVDLYAKAGVSHWQSALQNGANSSQMNGTDLAWGGGIGLHFTSLGARLEYEKVQGNNAPSLSMLSLGVSYTFL